MIPVPFETLSDWMLQAMHSVIQLAGRETQQQRGAERTSRMNTSLPNDANNDNQTATKNSSKNLSSATGSGRDVNGDEGSHISGEKHHHTRTKLVRAGEDVSALLLRGQNVELLVSVLVRAMDLHLAVAPLQWICLVSLIDLYALDPGAGEFYMILCGGQILHR